MSVGLFAAASFIACGGTSGHEQEEGVFSSVEQGASMHDDMLSKKDLAHLRKFSGRYHNVKHACADGYLLGINGIVTNCVSHPTDGAMGYHYGRQDLFDDPTIDEFEPEVLVYQVDEHGKLVLGAVEWVVPKAAWEAVHGAGAPPPVVHGHELTVLNPVLNWYVGHAWIWRDNPSGILSDWNPDVDCQLVPREPVETCE